MTDELDRLVALADLDGLVRLVDALCAGRDWDGLVRLRDRCRGAITTGRQLWPAVSLAEYRLALLAPAAVAAGVVRDGAAPFALGPLTEVVAQHHRWADLASALPPGPLPAYVAHERVLRGEDLRDAHVDPHVLELPLVLQPWEPGYPLPEYRDDDASFDPPPVPAAAAEHGDRPPPEVLDDLDATEALLELAGAWVRQSNGRSRAVAVRGDHVDAIAALGVARPRTVEISGADALAWMAWAAASGGAHGRRRGMAQGRFAAWWAVAALGGTDDLTEVGDVARDLRWWWFDAGEPTTGWGLRLAAADEAEGLAWAVTATDAA